jgi:hypothetical protein
VIDRLSTGTIVEPWIRWICPPTEVQNCDPNLEERLLQVYESPIDTALVVAQREKKVVVVTNGE